MSESVPDHRAFPTPSVSLATSSTNTDRSALNLRKLSITEFVMYIHTLDADYGNSCSVTISIAGSHTHTYTHTRLNKVGNAVPPPMAKAIGLEIKKSIMEKKRDPAAGNNTSSTTH